MISCRDVSPNLNGTHTQKLRFLTVNCEPIKHKLCSDITAHFSASVCCSLMPTLKWTGWTLSSIPLWISRGSTSNMVPGSGMRTLKPSRFPVMIGSMSGAELPVAWVTLKWRNNVFVKIPFIICPKRFILIFLTTSECLTFCFEKWKK